MFWVMDKQVLNFYCNNESLTTVKTITDFTKDEQRIINAWDSIVHETFGRLKSSTEKYSSCLCVFQ
jgi:hypothetical protein